MGKVCLVTLLILFGSLSPLRGLAQSEKVRAYEGIDGGGGKEHEAAFKNLVLAVVQTVAEKCGPQDNFDQLSCADLGFVLEVARGITPRWVGERPLSDNGEPKTALYNRDNKKIFFNRAFFPSSNESTYTNSLASDPSYLTFEMVLSLGFLQRQLAIHEVFRKIYAEMPEPKDRRFSDDDYLISMEIVRHYFSLDEKTRSEALLAVRPESELVEFDDLPFEERLEEGLEYLKASTIGQEDAISSISNAVERIKERRRQRALKRRLVRARELESKRLEERQRLSGKKRIAERDRKGEKSREEKREGERLRVSGDGEPEVFLFLGPDGVGKSFIPRVFARGTGVNYEHFRMNEYRYDEPFFNRDCFHGAQQSRLEKAIVEDPNTMVLFNEIEKASIYVTRDIHGFSKEGWEVKRCGYRKGQLTDSFVFINAQDGALLIADFAKYQDAKDRGEDTSYYKGPKTRDELKKAIIEELKESEYGKMLLEMAPPENRVLFRHFKRDEMPILAKLEVKRALRKLKPFREDSEEKIDIEIDQSLYDYLESAGYSKELGVRELRRLVEIYVLVRTTEAIGDLEEKGLSPKNIKLFAPIFEKNGVDPERTGVEVSVDLDQL